MTPPAEPRAYLQVTFCTDGKISVRINLPLFSTVLPSNSRLFLSYRPFVVITFSTGLVGVEVTSVSWLGQEVTSTPTRPIENVVIITNSYRTDTTYC